MLFARYRKTIDSGELPPDDLLWALVYHWGNVGWSADVRYLKYLLNEVLTSRNLTILECGSGLTTVLLGVIADRQSHQLISLEHHSEWHDRMCGRLLKERIQNATVYHCPLKNHGDFEWYDVSPCNFLDTPLIDLVVCDGPPAQTRGGRLGLPFVLGSALREGCVIAVDDTHRPSERRILDHWNMHFDLVPDASRSEGHFKVLVFRTSKP